MLPKQTQLTNQTLAIQVATPTLSWVRRPPTRCSPSCGNCTLNNVALSVFPSVRDRAASGGDGIRLGLIARVKAVPVTATVVERIKPEGVRSRRYQMAGFDKARVSES